MHLCYFLPFLLFLVGNQLASYIGTAFKLIKTMLKGEINTASCFLCWGDAYNLAHCLCTFCIHILSTLNKLSRELFLWRYKTTSPLHRFLARLGLSLRTSGCVLCSEYSHDDNNFLSVVSLCLQYIFEILPTQVIALWGRSLIAWSTLLLSSFIYHVWPHQEDLNKLRSLTG